MRRLALGLAGTAAALAAAPAIAHADTIVEAERLPLSPSSAGAVVAQSSASSGKALRLWSNASATRQLRVGADAARLVVRARGVPCQGAPVLTVDVDGERELRATVTAGSLTSYAATVDVPSGSHTVKIAYGNDLRKATCDRNVVVDTLRFVDAPDDTPATPSAPSAPVTGGATPSTAAPAAPSTPAVPSAPVTPVTPVTPAPTVPSSVAPVPAIGLPAGYRLVWQDDFTGALDTARSWWRYDGPGTNGVGTRVPGNVTTGDGELRIAARGTSIGGVGSAPDWTYGIFEIRARMDPGAAYSPAWMLWPASDVWPQDVEIDIAEHPGGVRSTMRTSIHYGTWPQHFYDTAEVAGDFTQWHTWTVVWTPGALTFHLDGKHYKTSTVAVPTTPHRWAMQVDVGPVPDWLPAPGAGASSMGHIDYVRTWQLG